MTIHRDLPIIYRNSICLAFDSPVAHCDSP